MQERLFAVRGATQVAMDDEIAIREAVVELFYALRADNSLETDNIVSIQFSVTPDLNSLNPAAALRSVDHTESIALFCMQEPVVDNMLSRTIRCLIHYYASENHRPKPIYLHGAKRLRPDLVQGKQ